MTTESVTTGTAAIREAVRMQVKRLRYGRLAHEVGVASETLLAFAENRIQLSPQQLCALAREIWPNAEFDPTADQLRPLNRTVRALCTAPPLPFNQPEIATTIGKYNTGPQPLDPPQPPAAKSRAGWLGGFFGA